MSAARWYAARAPTTSPLSINWSPLDTKSLAAVSSFFDPTGSCALGGRAAIQALLCAATEPLVRRSSTATSYTDADHSGMVISSRFAEFDGSSQVSEPIREAPDKVVPAGT